MRTLVRSLIALSITLAAAGCVSKKKYTALKGSNDSLHNKLDNCNRDLETSKSEKALCENNLVHLKQQVEMLSSTNAVLLNSVNQMTTLSTQEASNLEKSLEHIREQDLRIRRMHDALTRKDSVTLAVVMSLKKGFVDMNDSDVVVNVEKGVVFISLSDKMLFVSGSATPTTRAKEVLEKVAKVINGQPDQEVMVEGHTDNIGINRDCYKDNWDLSALRAVAITRLLQKDFGVAPERITAAGRSEYVPVADNATAEGRSKNRRIRIVIMPKLDQFYEMVEKGLKGAEE